MITHYEVLGVKENATSREIRKARKKLALCLHPDKNVGMNEMVLRLVEERFLEVQEAYATLSDAVRRSEYDAALAALRSEGEYYIPVPPRPAAPNPPAERKEAARCEKCHTRVGEPKNCICEGFRKQIAALEKEVRARRNLGITACRLCGCTPLDRSPLPGVCLRCWGNIANTVEQYSEKQLETCPRCGRLRRGGRCCPRCGLNSAAGGTRRSRKWGIAGFWKPAVGWSIVYLAISPVTGYWKEYLFIILAFLAFHLYIKWVVQER